MSGNGTVNGASLKKAIEGRDATTLGNFYADNAVLRIIDRFNTPSHPKELSGSAAIRAYWDDVCGREMTHHVEASASEGPTLALTESCAYPDGTKVFCAAMMDVADGRIVRQTVIQAWDE